jgi:hypothetical protein
MRGEGGEVREGLRGGDREASQLPHPLRHYRLAASP